jgi:hypothetical protein
MDRKGIQNSDILQKSGASADAKTGELNFVTPSWNLNPISFKLCFCEDESSHISGVAAKKKCDGNCFVSVGEVYPLCSAICKTASVFSLTYGKFAATFFFCL